MTNRVPFDSLAVPFDSLAKAREEARGKKGRDVWALAFDCPKRRPKRSFAEITALIVIDQIVNRSTIGVLSEDLETAVRDIARSSSRLKMVQEQRYLDWVLAAHQIQCSLSELVKSGGISESASIAVAEGGEFSENLTAVAGFALRDLQELADAVCDLYGCESPFARLSVAETQEAADFTIDFAGDEKGATSCDAAITAATRAKDFQGYTPMQVSEPVPIYPSRPTLEFLLRYLFRFDAFREGQYEALERALKRKDTIVLLPTGSGKSVIFQLLALATPGTAYIVAPIISLIDDQVQNLEARGIDRVVGLTGNVTSKSEIEKGLAEGRFLMCYVSPERFQIASFLESVREYAKNHLVSVIAIDEAHCVSEWGHDFRASYLGLGRTCREVCNTQGYVPPLLALTGTASVSVLTDMKRDHGIDDPGTIIKPKTFDRAEIHYRVVTAKSSEKMKALFKILNETLPREFDKPRMGFYDATSDEQTMSGIVFCQNVNGAYGLMNSQKAVHFGHPGVWDYLNEMFPHRCSYYCGKRPKSFKGMTDQEWAKRKTEQAARFKQNEMPIMVATKAFGMGIDKPNIRWVVHFGIPGSLESYYQEVGRAARDREDAYAYLILSDDYPTLNNTALDPAVTSLGSIAGLEERKGRFKGDDVSRCLFFHQSTFTGIDDELKVAEALLERCDGEKGEGGRWHVPFTDGPRYKDSDEDEKNRLERTIYRLTLLGAFNGYTVEYKRRGHGVFVIEPSTETGSDLRDRIVRNYLSYIRAYQSDVAFLEQSRKSLEADVEGIEDDREFILRTLRHMLENFTYKVIEEGRRRALRTMLMTARKASKYKSVKRADDSFRHDIVSYLSTEDSCEAEAGSLTSIINDATDVDKLMGALDQTRYWMEPSALQAQSLRLLEDYPQHYGFYYILCAMQAMQENGDEALSSAKSMVHFGVENYGLSPGQCAENFLRFLKSDLAEPVSIDVQDELVSYLAEAAETEPEALLEELPTEKAQTMLNIKRLSALLSDIGEVLL